MRLAPRIAREGGADGVLRLRFDDVHHAVLVGERPAEATKPASTSPSMKDACAGQSGCSSSGRDGSH